jgi:Predicted membrane protein
MNMSVSLIRTLLLYIVIIGAVRLMGKRQISELQTSELVVTLLISDIAAIPMQDTGQPLVSGLIPIAALVMCEIVVSCWMVKNAKFRKLICGSPIIVINDGKIDQKEMRRLRMTTEDLMEELRLKDVFSLEDVAYGIVETNGKMSVIKKPDKSQPTAGMLGIAVPDTGVEAVVISDGVIYDPALSLCEKSRDWLNGVLRGKNVKAEEVFIMTTNRKGDFNIIKKDEYK